MLLTVYLDSDPLIATVLVDSFIAKVMGLRSPRLMEGYQYSNKDHAMQISQQRTRYLSTIIDLLAHKAHMNTKSATEESLS
jgi:hypothetical protein